MIQVRNILYDKESQEADIELESNGVLITCYSHPVNNEEQIYNFVDSEIFAFQATDIQIDDIRDQTAIKTDKGYYSYFLRGKVISESQIQIHDFIIHIDYLPKDILAGEYVSCQCLRLDLGE